LFKRRTVFLQEEKNRIFSHQIANRRILDCMELRKAFLSPTSDKTPWSLRDIIIGVVILIPFIFQDKNPVLIDFFLHRPWLLFPSLLILTLASDGSLLFYSLYILKKRKFSLFPSMQSSQILREFLKAFFYFLFVIFTVGLLMLFVEIIFKTEMKEPGSALKLLPSNLYLIILCVTGFTLGPIVEEIFFRGFLYNALKSYVPMAIAGIVQAALFSVVHRYSFLNSLIVFIIGIALVVIYEKRRNLLSPIFVHMLMNSFFFIPLLVLTVQNLHTPALDWKEARVAPAWLKSVPIEQIERQEDGLRQWQYAIDKWGSKGAKKWKIEANAFNAVLHWFPNDRTACAKARLGIVTIYHRYLGDHRRAIIEADKLLLEYSDQKEQCASALAAKGSAFYMLKDFESSRASFDRVINDFKNHKESYEFAQRGIKSLEYWREKGK